MEAEAFSRFVHFSHFNLNNRQKEIGQKSLRMPFKLPFDLTIKLLEGSSKTLNTLADDFHTLVKFNPTIFNPTMN